MKSDITISTISLKEKARLIEESQKYVHCLTEEDIKHFKKIGSGTDASVYKLTKDLYLKLYDVNKPVLEPSSSSEEYVKTIRPLKFENTFKFSTKGYDEEGVRLGYDQIIELAKQKQHDIMHTFLPLNPCYIDGSFKGCIVKGYPYNLPIDSFRGLPEKAKLKLIRKLLEKFKELINNNVYPVDLYNKQNSSLPHNNIIVNAFLDPKIIDLDGKSVAYTEVFNQRYYEEAVFGLTTLILEFLFDQDLVDYFNEMDEYTDYYKRFFQGKGVPGSLIDQMLSSNISIDSLEDFIVERQRKR